MSLGSSWISTFPGYYQALEVLKSIVTSALKTGKIPQHVAFIMDGNRRFARKHHIEVKEGHNEGFNSLAEILDICYKCNVKAISIYAFSIENFKRSPFEVKNLMKLCERKFQQIIDHNDLCEKYGIKLIVSGDLSLLPDSLKNVLTNAQELTKNNSNAILNICIPYTSRDDITHSIRDINENNQNNKVIVSPQNYIDSIDEDCISKHLYTKDLPPLDILVRTSNIHRLSDFMLWETHLTGIYIQFLDILWPEFGAIRMIWIILKWSFIQYYNQYFKSI
ncbi:undecaprenyl diphosphate synthase family protein [Ascoidea rubescens DSM 1968]|uniref:Alkyl transferase n=1 Tax=Ascoidea rubescens DSM 1968 TaxID=1344418 RepID=A0A1D2VHD7_9ASCO|nr:cis-prenyltransferase [Ascoidea rubescens DSM 1968]ODV61009.1 cis-prenyltransferase [Ascoidea rubescens DSM 1968]